MVRHGPACARPRSEFNLKSVEGWGAPGPGLWGAVENVARTERSGEANLRSVGSVLGQRDWRQN